ncbi:MAG: glycoside hydrolase family 125 protein [Bacillota bacterium]
MNKILTVPKVLDNNIRVLYTGNHFISVPEIDTMNASVKSLNIVSIRNKGLVELSGAEELFKPLFYRNGKALAIKSVKANQMFYYIPGFIIILEDDSEIYVSIYTDLKEKGLIYDFKCDSPVDIELECNIERLNLLRFNRHETDFKCHIRADKWLGNPAADICSCNTSLGIAFGGDKDFSYTQIEENKLVLKLECSGSNAFYIAINSDTDGASTTLIHLRRKGYMKIFTELKDWLLEKTICCTNDSELEAILNRNLFFNYFFAVGKDMESDKYIALTSRSPRYYVSGAFWERDSFLWSFPAIRLIDEGLHKKLVREMILLHCKNAGDHAHYIDGTVLYPGFELDEAASYLLLLRYADENDSEVSRAIDEVMDRIEKEYDYNTGLYKTFLLPSDDPTEYPFVTIDNVILWSGLQQLAAYYRRKGKNELIDMIYDRADCIRKGIYKHLVKEINGRKMFVWSTDGFGNFRLYNDPPGNLGLLNFYGFVEKDDEVFRNTIEYYYSAEYEYFRSDASIKELACDHHPATPSGLGLCGSILNPLRQREAIESLRHAVMDYGLLCESFDWYTGEAKTGIGFATGSGYLAFALYHALFGE